MESTNQKKLLNQGSTSGMQLHLTFTIWI